MDLMMDIVLSNFEVQQPTYIPLATQLLSFPMAKRSYQKCAEMDHFILLS